MAEEENEEESKWRKVGYYEILGVETNATQEEIKKAFRKRAMQCHPDKGGDQEEFKRVGEAKLVLMDQECRNFYDMYGEDGVTFLKGWKEAKPNEMLKLGKLGVGGIVCFCCTNTICLLFLLLFPLLLCVKVAISSTCDGLLALYHHAGDATADNDWVITITSFVHQVTADNDWVWAFVFSPLFIIDTIVVLLLCVWPLLPVSMGKGDPLSNLRWDWLAQALCLVTFQIFLCIKLDGKDWRWILVLCPIDAFQAAVWDCLPSQYAEMSKLKKPFATCGYVVWIVYNLVMQSLWWLLWVLLQLRLDKEIDLTWWAVMAPALVLMVVWMFEATKGWNNPVVASGEQEEKAYEQAFSRWKFGFAFILLVLIIMAVLAAEGTSGFTMWAVWAPLYIVGGVFVCALCTTSVSLCRKEKDQGDWEDPSGFDSARSYEDGTPREHDPLNSDRPSDRV